LLASAAGALPGDSALRVVAAGCAAAVDVKKPARFRQPGHRVTGDRREIAHNRGGGYDCLHCVLDDHSRFVQVELHPHEDGKTAARVLGRALAELAEHGLALPEAAPVTSSQSTPTLLCCQWKRWYLA
jgi:hypothetical protein